MLSLSLASVPVGDECRGLTWQHSSRSSVPPSLVFGLQEPREFVEAVSLSRIPSAGSGLSASHFDP